MDVTYSPFDLYQWMEPDVAAAYSAAQRRRRYSAGQTIYLQGEPGTEMFRVVEGSVRMSMTRRDGREVILLFFQPGDCFGDSSLVDGEPRPQTTEAMTDIVVDVVEIMRFEQLRAHYRGFDTALLKLLARQMRAVSEQFTTSSLDDLPSRVAQRILAAVRDFGADGSDGTRLTVRLPQSEIATMVGASRQSVNRVLQRLQSDGVVRTEYGNLLVRDLAALRAVAGRN